MNGEGALAHDVFRRDMPVGTPIPPGPFWSCSVCMQTATAPRPGRNGDGGPAGRMQRTVSAALGSLQWIDHNVLIVTRRPRRADGGGSLPTVYRVDLSGLPLKAGEQNPRRRPPWMATTSQ